MKQYLIKTRNSCSLNNLNQSFKNIKHFDYSLRLWQKPSSVTL